MPTYGPTAPLTLNSKHCFCTEKKTPLGGAVSYERRTPVRRFVMTALEPGDELVLNLFDWDYVGQGGRAAGGGGGGGGGLLLGFGFWGYGCGVYSAWFRVEGIGFSLWSL
jgi:hypothetical protein